MTTISIKTFLILLFLTLGVWAIVPDKIQVTGISPECFYVYLFGSLFFSNTNIPIYKRQVPINRNYEEVAPLIYKSIAFGYYIVEQTIAVNIGGAVFPCILSLYFALHTPIKMVVIGIVIGSLSAYILSRYIPGIGVVSPIFGQPMIAVAVGLIFLNSGYILQVAFITGTLGTIIGADLLRLRQCKDINTSFISIGGAGIFDGVYLTGLVSVLISSIVHLW